MVADHVDGELREPLHQHGLVLGLQPPNDRVVLQFGDGAKCVDVCVPVQAKRGRGVSIELGVRECMESRLLEAE